MDSSVGTLAHEFHRKGINRGQLPRLLKDIETFLNDNGCRSIRLLNLELESLGWGIKLVDQQTFEHILQLLELLKFEGLKSDEIQFW